MDPIATLALIAAALRDDDLDDATDAALAYVEWRARGGYRPQDFQTHRGARTLMHQYELRGWVIWHPSPLGWAVTRDLPEGPLGAVAHDFIAGVKARRALVALTEGPCAIP